MRAETYDPADRAVRLHKVGTERWHVYERNNLLGTFYRSPRGWEASFFDGSQAIEPWPGARETALADFIRACVDLF